MDELRQAVDIAIALGDAQAAYIYSRMLTHVAYSQIETLKRGA